MTSESIGAVFPTQIPGISDNADIQLALKLYHYGQSTSPATQSQSVRNSISGHLNNLDVRTIALETQGIGSIVQNDEPTGTIPNGYIWVDKDSVAPVIPDFIAKYQTSAPTGTIATGALWVDSDSSPLTMYVYSGTAWREIGSV